MCIDVDREHLLTMAEAARRIPGRPSIRTLWRWVNQGVCGQRLETIKVGSRRFTSREAIERFIDRGTNPANSPRESSTRQRAIAKAERELQEAGF